MQTEIKKTNFILFTKFGEHRRFFLKLRIEWHRIGRYIINLKFITYLPLVTQILRIYF